MKGVWCQGVLLLCVLLINGEISNIENWEELVEDNIDLMQDDIDEIYNLSEDLLDDWESMRKELIALIKPSNNLKSDLKGCDTYNKSKDVRDFDIFAFLSEKCD